MTGTCRLCNAENVALQDSHLMPAGIYTIARGDDPNPILVTRKVAVRTSRQVRGHLLCSACEQLFNARGENWVIRNCWHAPDDFPLHEGLSAATPIAQKANTRLFRADTVPHLRVEDFVYFGASVFWRAAVHRWSRDAEGQIRFGPYEEDLQRFLLDQTAFPDSMAMLLMVSSSKAEADNRMMSLPWLAGRNPIHQYRFDIPGVTFALFVGQQAKLVAGSGCAGRFGTVVVTPAAERERLKAAATVARGISIKGKPWD